MGEQNFSLTEEFITCAYSRYNQAQHDPLNLFEEVMSSNIAESSDIAETMQTLYEGYGKTDSAAEDQDDVGFDQIDSDTLFRQIYTLYSSYQRSDHTEREITEGCLTLRDHLLSSMGRFHQMQSKEDSPAPVARPGM